MSVEMAVPTDGGRGVVDEVMGQKDEGEGSAPGPRTGTMAWPEAGATEEVDGCIWRLG